MIFGFLPLLLFGALLLGPVMWPGDSDEDPDEAEGDSDSAGQPGDSTDLLTPDAGPTQLGAGADLLATPSALTGGGASEYGGSAAFDRVVTLDESGVRAASGGVEMGDGQDVVLLDGLTYEDATQLGPIRLGGGDDVVVSPGSVGASPDIYGEDDADRIGISAYNSTVDGGAATIPLLCPPRAMRMSWAGPGMITSRLRSMPPMLLWWMAGPAMTGLTCATRKM